MSGIAFDRAIREKMEQQKKAGSKRPADIDSDEDDNQPPAQPTNQRPPP